MSQEIPRDALRTLQIGIHYEFKQVKLLIQALTHTSHANEHGSEHNERLEFLGDAVLELSVSSALFSRFPDAQEGHLTRMRSAMVSEDALARVAERIDLGAMVRLGRGEESQGGRTKKSVLSDALEAVLGAVFLDGGLDAAATCVNFLFEGYWPSLPSSFRPRDCKSRLQEYTQHIWKERPTYTLQDSHGPEHSKRYTIVVTLPDGSETVCEGASIRKAEQGAAERAIQELEQRYPDLVQATTPANR